MLHTFFLTVVSIDCQRLELADLLRQGVEQPRKAQMQAQSDVKHVGEHGNAVGAIHENGKALGIKSQKSSWIKGARSIWKARTARGGSMVVVSATSYCCFVDIELKSPVICSCFHWSRAFIISMNLIKRIA